MERQKRDCIPIEGHNVGLHDIHRTTKKDKLSCASSLHATMCMARALAEEHNAMPRDEHRPKNGQELADGEILPGIHSGRVQHWR